MHFPFLLNFTMLGFKLIIQIHYIGPMSAPLSPHGEEHDFLFIMCDCKKSYILNRSFKHVINQPINHDSFSEEWLVGVLIVVVYWWVSSLLWILHVPWHLIRIYVSQTHSQLKFLVYVRNIICYPLTQNVMLLSLN